LIHLYRFTLKSGRLSSPKSRIFVALLGKHPLSSRKHDNNLGVARQFCVPTQLATPLGTKKKIHTMITDPKNTSDLDPDNIIPVTFDDLSKEDWREFKRGIEEEKAARLKQYFKTRSGAVKKGNNAKSSSCTRHKGN
jgi:hypothetical protein